MNIILHLFLAISIFSLGASEIPLSKKEREQLSEMWNILYYDCHFAYTLVGTKPVTIANWEENIDSFWLNHPLLYYFDKVKNEWLKLIKEKHSKNFAFIFSDLYVDKKHYKQIMFINKKEVMACFEYHKSFFLSRLAFKDLSPETIAKTVINSSHNDLIGLLLGFEIYNSSVFQRRNQLRNQFQNNQIFPEKLILSEDELAWLNDPFSPTLNTSNFNFSEQLKIALSTELSSLNEMSENKFSRISLPALIVDKNAPETLALLNRYEEERKKVLEFARTKIDLDKILKKYFE